MTRKQLIALLASAVMVVIAVAYARRSASTDVAQQPQRGDAAKDTAMVRYADPASCAECHDEIARTYSRTGMARSFSKLKPGAPPAGITIDARLHHEASSRHYTIAEKGGRLHQRRHEIGFQGRETPAVEFEMSYSVGSGNHARTFLHRNPDGRLRELPVSWYAERGGYWAMSPGYDRPAHQDFRRLVNEDCMGCHNGYPRGAVQEDGNGPKFPEPLPEGIDCQRCHGPGQAHVEAIKAGDLARARSTIANPATFTRERQLETCMQCHLEPTSTPLPFQIRRYENPPLSYTPGKPLSDYFLYFDHAPGTGRDDKFEIAGAAYRLRQSACFQRSEMTCVTCHNPHDIPRGAEAVRRYVAVCEGCHTAVHNGGVPPVPRAGAGATCIDCHMPRRRAEDAVHVVMTDHNIQRRRPDRDLLAPRKEADISADGDYRGEVVLSYPPKLPATPENELYLALAQVQQGSNLDAGIPRLEQAIAAHKPGRADFYFELARAYSKTSNYEAVIRWCEEALRRDANFAPALKELAAASTLTGRLGQAAVALEKAVALRPKDSDAFADLGSVYLQQDRADEAERALRQALVLDPGMPAANNTMGLAALKRSDTVGAEHYFRAAIRHQPDLAEAQNNLGNLLASRRAYAEAGHHFEQAILSKPDYVEAHHSHGVVLAVTRSYPQAVAALQAAVRFAGLPARKQRWAGLAQAHTDLADVLIAMGRIDDGMREYALAIQVNPAEYSAHLRLGELLARRGRTADARPHLEAAVRSADADLSAAARAALRGVQR